MTLTIACLHTADSNLPLFEAACPPGVRLMHRVRPDLLSRAATAADRPQVLTETAAVLTDLAETADAVVLSCSTLGPAVALRGWPVPVVRSDEALARAAAAIGPDLPVLYTAPSSRDATEALFSAHLPQARFHLVAGAWELFLAGEAAGYAAAIASAADAFAGPVIFAQVSMTPAAALCRQARPLTAPGVALRALVQQTGKNA